MSQNRRDPLKRLEQGEALAAEGCYAEALREYLWCFDRGLRVDPAFAGVRLTALLYAIAQLGNFYPPASEALILRRNRLRQKLLRGRARVMSAFDFCGLNRYLSEEDVTFQTCRKLRPGGKVRMILVDHAAGYLCGMRRYRGLLKLADPFAVFAVNFPVSDSASSTEPASYRRRLGKSLLARKCAPFVEALAGTQRHEHAFQLAGRILRVRLE